MLSRVLIDATAIPGDRGGVGRYLDGMLASLPEALAGTALDVAVICRADDAEQLRSKGLEVVIAPAATRRAAFRMAWEQIAIPRIVRRGRFDLLHSPHYTFPLVGSFRRIVTVHDLTFFTLPDQHTTAKRLLFRFWLRRIARRRLPVLAVSAATASEFARLLGPDTGPVTITRLGYDAAIFHVPSAAERIAFASSLDPAASRWIAFLGTLEPRKNVPALIAAHARLGAGTPPLLLAGAAGWDARVDSTIESAVAQGSDVRRLGYLALADLAAFLGGADLVVYPSLGEGFGLPVLEAMASGACVVTTDRLALPEVGGDAVAYTGVSADEIADTLTTLLADDALRSDFAARARERAAGFTWEVTAERHVSAYSEALA